MKNPTVVECTIATQPIRPEADPVRQDGSSLGLFAPAPQPSASAPNLHDFLLR